MSRLLFSSAGFITILDSSEYKFDYSAKKEYLRKTTYRRIGSDSLEKVGEEVYRFVSSEAERSIIKNEGGKWIPLKGSKDRNLKIYEHVSKNDFITGWYKTVTRKRNMDGSYTNWVRYYRRVGDK